MSDKTPEQRQIERGARAAQRVAAAERRATAWQLHLAGVSYAQISKQLGVSRTQAHRDVQHVLKQLHAEQLHDADHERTKSLARLERLIQGLFGKAVKGDHYAADTIRKLEADRIRLLGLAPTIKAEISGPGGGPLEITAGVVVVPAVAGSVQAWREQVTQDQAAAATNVVELRALEGGS
jgi:hypothetical protein